VLPAVPEDSRNSYRVGDLSNLRVISYDGDLLTLSPANATLVVRVGDTVSTITTADPFTARLHPDGSGEVLLPYLDYGATVNSDATANVALYASSNECMLFLDDLVQSKLRVVLSFGVDTDGNLYVFDFKTDARDLYYAKQQTDAVTNWYLVYDNQREELVNVFQH
jgi:hypothetical protein